MLEIGFNLVNLATNHVMDKDLEGLQYSASFWEKQDAYTAGSYTSQEKRDNIKIAEKNGKGKELWNDKIIFEGEYVKDK